MNVDHDVVREHTDDSPSCVLLQLRVFLYFLIIKEIPGFVIRRLRGLFSQVWFRKYVRLASLSEDLRTSDDRL